MPKPVSTLLELVYIKKLNLQQIEARDVGIIQYLEEDQSDLYATLIKAVKRKAVSM